MIVHRRWDLGPTPAERSAALTVLELWQLWGPEPVRLDAFRGRLYPDASRLAAKRTWERLKAKLAACGYAVQVVAAETTNREGVPTSETALRLTRAAVARALEVEREAADADARVDARTNPARRREARRPGVSDEEASRRLAAVRAGGMAALDAADAAGRRR